MEMKELFVTNRVTVRDLVPNRINPRKIKSEEKKKLWERLNRFGMIGIPVRDADGTLLSGHQRCELMMSYGFGEYVIDVRTATRKLTDQEIKEVMLIENSHAGEFDFEMLRNEFSGVDVADFGLTIEELTADIMHPDEKEEEPELPIVPKFSERYEAFVIICSNEIDANHIAEKLGVDRAKSYKSDAIGQSHVVQALNVIERWK
jgi:hypothetical protein